MQAYIYTEEDLEKIIAKITEQTVKKVMPDVIRKATRPEWLNTEEAKEILKCSTRHLQYLRDTKQLPFSQNGRTIRYHIDDIEAFLNRHKVESK
ncbi:MAG: helix-turn-helix domain-containing protein [Candidatus Paceibacterota bacterium]